MIMEKANPTVKKRLFVAVDANDSKSKRIFRQEIENVSNNILDICFRASSPVVAIICLANAVRYLIDSQDKDPRMVTAFTVSLGFSWWKLDQNDRNEHN